MLGMIATPAMSDLFASNVKAIIITLPSALMQYNWDDAAS